MNQYCFPIRFFFVLVLLSSCKQESHRAFYYWKSVYKLSQSEKNYLQDINVTHLYIKFFDVDWDEATGNPTPIASIQFSEEIPPQCKVIPVIFIVNRTLQKTTFMDMADLANKIYEQTKYLASKNNIHFKELQLDCDWTEKTRVNYFALLNILKKKLETNGIQLSTTIRLHQIKYKNITGIPPVDRGMLMYYNMGKITSNASLNSIFNESDAAKYIDHISDYPLKLDVALPAFSWSIHIRNAKVIELLNNMSYADFKSSNKFTLVNSSTYTATQSFFFRGFYFMKDDSIKVEEITPEQCKIASKQLRKKLSKTRRVAIFHLDSLILSKYEKKDFEEIFDAYH